jgi:hypothetical protein
MLVKLFDCIQALYCIDVFCSLWPILTKKRWIIYFLQILMCLSHAVFNLTRSNDFGDGAFEKIKYAFLNTCSFYASTAIHARFLVLRSNIERYNRLVWILRVFTQSIHDNARWSLDQAITTYSKSLRLLKYSRHCVIWNFLYYIERRICLHRTVNLSVCTQKMINSNFDRETE